jgi:hypothetical protein
VNPEPASAYRHPIKLRGAYASPDDAQRSRPSILQLSEQDFIDRLINDLSTPQGRKRLQADIAATRNKKGTLRLYQAVHRISHAVLVDVSCALPGEPRLDANRILEAGLVVRRRAPGKTDQGWMKRSGEILGWQKVPQNEGIRKIQYDPDPKLRKQRQLGRNAAVLKMLSAADAPAADWQEDYTTLFKAPPDVCKAAGRTFLYGVIPLTSTEYAEGSQSIQAPPFTKNDIRRRMPALLKAGGSERKDLPPTGLTLTEQSRRISSAKTFFATLGYLSQETGLFTDAPGTERLRKTLDSIPLTDRPAAGFDFRFPAPGSTGPEIKQRDQSLNQVPVFEIKPQPSLGGFLRQAFEVLMGQPASGTEASKDLPASITLPDAWPTIASDSNAAVSARGFLPVSEQMIVDAVYTAMQARWNTLQQVQSRFEETDATYVIRTFIRVQDTPDCPPRTLWTENSEAFEIVPWYESGDQPPVKVELPDIDRNLLSKLKPNVAFKVPHSVQKFMDNIDLGNLTAGDSPPESKLGFGMICGFNIPIITLCAFIVLSIFIALLNIVFWWLPFVKICIPFPKKE